MALQISAGTTLVCMLALIMASLSLNTVASSRTPIPSAPDRSTKFSYPSTLKYYIHAILATSTAYIVHPVNPVATGTFGQIAVFSYTATMQPEMSSTQVGSIRGFEVYDSVDTSYATILVVNTLTYDDGVYNGTISLHGQADINLTNYEITVVGGTADFRGVSGYAAITNLRTPGSDHVFEHVLHFF